MNGVFVRIVVSTDFSPCSKHAWQLAQRLATALGSELILVHVFVEGTLWSESPFNIGTHGRTGLAKLFLGSVAGRVVSTAKCPVMTVRGK